MAFSAIFMPKPADTFASSTSTGHGPSHFASSNRLRASTRVATACSLEGDALPCERHILLLAKRASLDVAKGSWNPDALPERGVDLIAQCLGASILLSQSIRTDTTFWCHFSSANCTLEVDGGVRAAEDGFDSADAVASAVSRQLKLDERGIAATIQQALLHACPPRSAEDAADRWRPMRRHLEANWRARRRRALWEDGGLPAVQGFRVHWGESLAHRLDVLTSRAPGAGSEPALITLKVRPPPHRTACYRAALSGAARAVTQGDGAPLAEVLTREALGGAGGACGSRVVVALGDDSGISAEEEAALAQRGAAAASLGRCVYLASHAAVMVHAALDTALCTGAPRRPLCQRAAPRRSRACTVLGRRVCVSGAQAAARGGDARLASACARSRARYVAQCTCTASPAKARGPYTPAAPLPRCPAAPPTIASRLSPGAQT